MDAASRPLRVLISAYACGPQMGSEPGAGWTWTRAAAERHEVWVMTREKFAAAIAQACREEPALRLHAVHLDLPPWVQHWKRREGGSHWYYLLWQLWARRVALRLHSTVGFDVAHHLTFAVDWMPVAVANVPGVPFVWGPVGGATGTPVSLWGWLGWRGRLDELRREALTRLARPLFAGRVARRAALVVAQNYDVARKFRRARRVVVEPNVAVAPLAELTSAKNGRRQDQDGEGRRQAVFVGRLLPMKGLRLAVASLARSEAAGWQLDVYGAGPERDSAERLAAGLGVVDRVSFKGERPRVEVLRALAAADALVAPFFHDQASWAVAEALAVGCPVVCLDRGGQAVLVGPADGVKVAVAGDVVGKLAAALSSLTGRIPPVGRWGPDRLPGLLAGWYEEAASSRPFAVRPTTT
jgi:glycosyltransferase involved in cell wall biosynthesis